MKILVNISIAEMHRHPRFAVPLSFVIVSSVHFIVNLIITWSQDGLGLGCLRSRGRGGSRSGLSGLGDLRGLGRAGHGHGLQVLDGVSVSLLDLLQLGLK